jgi:GDPmannose 4,6-dehydratase
VVRVNPQYYRPTEVELLIGYAQKAHDVLGWKATTHLEELCQLMVDADVERVRTGSPF